MSNYEIEREIASLERRAKNKRSNAALSPDSEYRKVLEMEALELEEQAKILQTKTRGKRTGVAVSPRTGNLRTRSFKGIQIRYKS
jgi:hypothetical protein